MAANRTYNFFESYPGPLGPHLNCLSEYTRTRKEEDRLIGRAIRGAGKNTCKAPSGGSQRRAIVGLQEHLARHPNDRVAEARLAVLGGSLVTLAEAA